ncbi:MAG: sigma-70 family RNA polymerase sigma factor [Planctomycetia bacterium]|nr:sigma-70 family RNA polymerase sigma factor [Planctomycetia bacterium]
MPNQNQESLNRWASRFNDHRERLLLLATRNLNPVLIKRFSPEDIVQDVFLKACSRMDYFENNQDIPVYIKLRTILLQTIVDIERKHLQSSKRDAYKERTIEEPNEDQVSAQVDWDMFADSLTSPLSKLARDERDALLDRILKSLSDNDRQILTLRHFDGLSNVECAQALEIEPKTASIRYVRALQRLKNKLADLSEFYP